MLTIKCHSPAQAGRRVFLVPTIKTDRGQFSPRSGGKGGYHAYYSKDRAWAVVIADQGLATYYGRTRYAREIGRTIVAPVSREAFHEAVSELADRLAQSMAQPADPRAPILTGLMPIHVQGRGKAPFLRHWATINEIWMPDGIRGKIAATRCGLLIRNYWDDTGVGPTYTDGTPYLRDCVDCLPDPA